MLSWRRARGLGQRGTAGPSSEAVEQSRGSVGLDSREGRSAWSPPGTSGATTWRRLRGAAPRRAGRGHHRRPRARIKRAPCAREKWPRSRPGPRFLGSPGTAAHFDDGTPGTCRACWISRASSAAAAAALAHEHRRARCRRPPARAASRSRRAACRVRRHELVRLQLSSAPRATLASQARRAIALRHAPSPSQATPSAAARHRALREGRAASGSADGSASPTKGGRSCVARSSTHAGGSRSPEVRQRKRRGTELGCHGRGVPGAALGLVPAARRASASGTGSHQGSSTRRAIASLAALARFLGQRQTKLTAIWTAGR